MSTVEAGEPFPLYWPTGWPRVESWRRRKSKYDKAFVRDRDAILRRLKNMYASHVVISSNIPLRRDGLPLAGQRAPDDPGVAVYFTRRGKDHVVACDAWVTVDENLRAVLRTLEALHAIERSGSAQLQDRAFAGFARLPADTFDWRSELGIPSGQIVDRVLIEERFRARALCVHPDRGGTHDAMARLNRARADALREVSP